MPRQEQQNPNLSDPVWLAKRLRRGDTNIQIAESANAAPRTVIAWIRRHNLGYIRADLKAQQRQQQQASRVKPRPRPVELDDPNWLRSQIAHGRSQRDIANELGVQRAAVGAALRHHDLDYPPRPPKTKLLWDRDWLSAQLRAGRSQRDIANELGCSKTTVNKAVIAMFGPQARGYKQLRDRAWLKRAIEQGRTDADIAHQLGCHPKTVRDAIDAHGLWRNNRMPSTEPRYAANDMPRQ